MSKEIEAGLEIAENISSRLKLNGGTFAQLDGVIYELIEAAIVAPEVGNFIQWLYDGETVTECEFCNIWGVGMNINESCGLMACENCEE
jgi:hypothetical protein